MGMRIVGTVGVGGIATALAFFVSSSAAGLLGALAFVLYPFLGAITIGIAIGQLVGMRSRKRSLEPSRCSSCRQAMGQIGALWVCGICDAAPHGIAA